MIVNNFVDASNYTHISNEFQCFHIGLVACYFRSLVKSRTRHWQHGARQGAHVHETSVCVTYFAPWFVNNICSFSWCSKYVTFSLTFCALVRQNTLCVTYGAPRRSLPSRLWGGPLATWAAKPGQTSPWAYSDLPSSILRSRLRHAYEVAWRHRAG